MSDTHTQLNNDEECLFCVYHLEEAALGIIEAEDRMLIEQHLSVCEVCRNEFSELVNLVHLLPFTSDQVEPHPSVREQLMQRISSDPPAEPSHLEIALPTRVKAKATTPRKPEPPARRPLWMYGSVFAGLCVALIAISIWNIWQPAGTPIPSGNLHLYAMESNCETCHENTGGQISADPDQSESMVIAWNLDPEETHEVWCVKDSGEKVMVGELDVAQTGNVLQAVSFPEAVGVYQQIYVARNDGTEELTVTPAKSSNSEDTDPEETPPGSD